MLSKEVDQKNLDENIPTTSETLQRRKVLRTDLPRRSVVSIFNTFAFSGSPREESAMPPLEKASGEQSFVKEQNPEEESQKVAQEKEILRQKVARDKETLDMKEVIQRKMKPRSIKRSLGDKQIQADRLTEQPFGDPKATRAYGDNGPASETPYRPEDRPIRIVARQPQFGTPKNHPAKSDRHNQEGPTMRTSFTWSEELEEEEDEE